VNGHVFPALAPALRPALPKLVAGTVMMMLSGLASLGGLWCIVRLVGDISLHWAIVASSLWLLGAALAAYASWLAHDAESRFAARLRRQVAGHLTRLPASTLARQGDVVLRRLVSDDIAALHHMVAHLPAEVVTFAVIPLASISMLVVLAGPVALWALLPGVLASLYYLVWMPRMSARYGAQRMQIMGEIVSAVDDYARGIRVHRIYGAQTGALAAYRNAAERFTEGMVAWVGKVASAAAIAVALLQAVATFAIAYAITYQRDAPTLAAALFFSLAIVTPALRLGHGLDYVTTGWAAGGRLAAFLREPVVPSGNTTLPDGCFDLEILDAQMELNGHHVLGGLSHRFVPGTLTAITGPSGAGKTSLLRALAGLELLCAGSIRLAGIDMAHLNEQARHQALLLLPQGGEVLSATVRENLALSESNTTDEELTVALRQVQLAIDLDADAAQLSGGERQRLGLARVFLTFARILLLDEPTSALDKTVATRLLTTLRELAHTQSKIIILVTHDPDLTTRADARLELQRNVTETSA